MTNLAATVRRTVREHADATAISVDGTETSYAEFWALTGRFAGALRERGVGPGDRIAIYLPNLPQFVVAYYGILRVGGVVVPIDPTADADGIEPILGNSTSGAIVTTTDRVPEIEKIHERTLLQFIVTADGPGDYSTGFAEFLGESPDVDFWSVAERDDDDVAVLASTSGTDDDPKGVLLTHGNLSAHARAVADLPPDGMGPEDGVLGALPFFHSYGMSVAMNAALAGGASITPMRTWDAGAALTRLEERDLTVFAGVPEMYREMVAHPDADDVSLSSVRFATAGGARLPADVREAFESAFEPTIHENYGLTEACSVTHVEHPDRERRSGSVGQPIDGVEARVVNASFEARPPVDDAPLDPTRAPLDELAGELVLAGPTVADRYHEAAEVNAAAFTGFDGQQWLHTGDVVYYDEDDYYYFVDRKTDVFEVADDVVFPTSVERTLCSHEHVTDAAVAAAEDDDGNQLALAFAVRDPDADVAVGELLEYWLAAFPESRYPRAVEFVPELPRTVIGALDRSVLRDRATELELDPVAPDPASSDDAAGLQDLDGISGSRAGALSDAGFETLADLRAASRDELAEIEGFGDALADRIKRQVEDDG